MRHFKWILFVVFASFLLVFLVHTAIRYTPATREAEAERLIQLNLPPGSDSKQVIKFLASQDAAFGMESRTGRRDIFGNFALVPPRSRSEYRRLGVPFQWLQGYEHGVGFYFVIDAKGKMVSFQVYPPR